MIEKPKVDTNSPTWIAIREYHIARLDELRRKNDKIIHTKIDEKFLKK